MDFIGQEIKDKLQNLILELSKIYPCTLSILVLDDEILRAQSLPTLNGNYLAYYRLKIGSVLPQSITKCVYLDIDMLVLGDLRELFAIDLQGKICGAVMDYYNANRVLKPKSETYPPIDISVNYFNSGMMLIDLELWRKEKIEKKIFEIAANYYCPTHDQDILNAVMLGRFYKLSIEWNILAYVYCDAICLDDKGKINISYQRKDFNNALKNPKIFHYYIRYKPWRDSKIYLDYHNKFLGQYWWDMVEQTPIFKEELLKKKPQADNALSFQCYLGYQLLKLYQKGLFLATPFYVYYFYGKKDLIKMGEIPLQDYNLSYQLGRLAAHAYSKCKQGRLMELPFRVISVIRRFRKNQARIF